MSAPNVVKSGVTRAVSYDFTADNLLLRWPPLFWKLLACQFQCTRGYPERVCVHAEECYWAFYQHFTRR